MGHKSEIKSQMSEVRGQMSEDSPQDTAEPCPYTLVVACDLSFCNLLLKDEESIILDLTGTLSESRDQRSEVRNQRSPPG
jgi:hypothetical protein